MAQQNSDQRPAGNGTLSHQLTYRGLLERLAEHPAAAHFCTPKDLPELSLPDLGAVLLHYPEALIEAIADFDPTATLYTAQTLADPAKSLSQTYSLIGIAVVSAVRSYVIPLVLRDVQQRFERNREADAIEVGAHLQPALTCDQLLAAELGLGRSLS